MSIILEMPNSKKNQKLLLKDNIVQIMQKQEQIPTIQQDERFFNIKNYIVLHSKQKVNLNFISKDQYLESLSLISKTFMFDFKALLQNNPQIQSQNLIRKINAISESQNLESILSQNESTEFMKSYAQFTRKTNQVVFLLIIRNQKFDDPCYQKQGQLRTLFVNEEGKVIHVVSNLDSKTIPKLKTIITKHFRRLQSFFVVDLTCDLQQSNLITKHLQPSKNSYKLIFISPIAEELQKESRKTNQNPQPQLFQLNHASRQKQDLIGYCLILGQKDHKVKNLETNIEKALRFQRVHDFVFGNLYNSQKSQKLTPQILFVNSWLNNVFAWYFNIVQSVGTQTQLELKSKSTLQAINNKIAKVFSTLINQSEQNQINYNFQGNCFADILQISKTCIVCKSCKPKYGCIRCSKKYKMDIYLCIEKCFKAFHKDAPKFLSNKYSNFSQALAVSQKQKLNPENKSQVVKVNDQIPKHYLAAPSPPQNKSECQDLIYRHKIIKKRVKRIQKKTSNQIPLCIFNGIKLYNFIQKPWTEIECEESSEMLQEDQQEESYGQVKCNQMEQEQSNSTDSLRS